MQLPDNIKQEYQIYKLMGRLSYNDDMNPMVALKRQEKSLKKITDFAEKNGVDLNYMIKILKETE